MFNYLLLGVIQGLTEFFPVSSSAHLVIAQHILGITENGLAISLVLHLGTILALLIFFYKNIFAALKDKRTIFLIAVVTVVTGAIGLLGKDFFEGLFSSIRDTALQLMATGVILLLTVKFMEAKRKEVRFLDALILGITQGIAIIPGISRSGITIASLLFRGIDKETAFNLSFLASIPAILGAALLEFKEVNTALKFEPLNLGLGFVASLLTGLFSLWALKLVVLKAKLHYFGYYCIIIAIMTLLFIK